MYTVQYNCLIEQNGHLLLRTLNCLELSKMVLERLVLVLRIVSFLFHIFATFTF